MIELKLRHHYLEERGGWEGESIEKELNPQLPGQKRQKMSKINKSRYVSLELNIHF